MTTPSIILQAYAKNPNDAKAREAFTDLYGSYNEAPRGWREISEKEFAQGMFFSYNPEYRETRQMHRPKGGNHWGKMLAATLFFFWDGTGVAMGHDYWKGKVIYYAFGCHHTYRELSFDQCRERGLQHMGRCWHVNECTTCGQIWSYDSSD